MMKCPVCDDADLLMGERLGVGIDYCPACRGVWLERGRLDKLVERAEAGSPSQAAPTAERQRERDDRSRDDRSHDDRSRDEGFGARHHDDQGHDDRGHGSGKSKKKTSIFGDILGGLGGD